MRRSLILGLALICQFITSGQTISKTGWKTFTDTAGMFTAQYPPNWVNKIKEGNRVFFTSPSENETDNFNENINISVKYNAGYGSQIKINELFPAVTNQLKTAFRDFKSESQRSFTWNKAEAVEIIYSGFSSLDDNMRIRIIQWFCFYKSRLYTVTYTATASNTALKSTALAIMGSIRF
jgi:PsbP-like protein